MVIEKRISKLKTLSKTRVTTFKGNEPSHKAADRGYQEQRYSEQTKWGGKKPHKLHYPKGLGRHLMEMELLYLCANLQLHRNSFFCSVCPLSGGAAVAIFAGNTTYKFKKEQQMLPSA